MPIININASYNFTTLAPSILGASYVNMKVKGLVTIDEAVKHTDVVTKHAAVRPLISGLPVSPNNLTFVIFVDGAGNELVIAESYIDPASLVLVTTVNLSIQVFDVPSTMEAMLRLRLKELGVVNFTITPV